jgi:hypothetical protein
MEIWWCFYGIEIMPFSSIWDVCVVVGHKMIVCQGNCQVKGGWRKFRGRATEG